MNAWLTSAVNSLTSAYASLVEGGNSALATQAAQKNFLITAAIVVVIVALLLLGVIAVLPTRRKIVRTRRVRRTRRKVTSQQQPQVEATATSADAATTPAVRARSNVWVAAVAVVAGLLVVTSFLAAYIVTGTDKYCGTTCHARDSHVAAAVRSPHARCIDCHESGPISGGVSRLRMAWVQSTGQHDIVSIPVDSDRCLRCHRSVESSTVQTKTGLMVSHKEALAAGRACGDCHPNAGHASAATVAGVMTQCMSCHDGKTARAGCDICHKGGSPTTVASAARKAASSFDYGPAIRVSNRDCERCHGAETECRACHNGLVLPHPADFVNGGHARMAAFAGKEKCMKCHTMAWCGNDKCHHSFSAHDPVQWVTGHQTGTSLQCGSCHMSWNGKRSFCKVCH